MVGMGIIAIGLCFKGYWS